MRRGKPVPADETLASLVQAGLLTPARLVDSASPPPRKPVASLRELLAELAKDREDR